MNDQYSIGEKMYNILRCNKCCNSVIKLKSKQTKSLWSPRGKKGMFQKGKGEVEYLIVSQGCWWGRRTNGGNEVTFLA